MVVLNCIHFGSKAQCFPLTRVPWWGCKEGAITYVYSSGHTTDREYRTVQKSNGRAKIFLSWKQGSMMRYSLHVETLSLSWRKANEVPIFVVQYFTWTDGWIWLVTVWPETKDDTTAYLRNVSLTTCGTVVNHHLFMLTASGGDDDRDGP